MKTPTLVWRLMICAVGLGAALVGWEWLDDQCVDIVKSHDRKKY